MKMKKKESIKFALLSAVFLALMWITNIVLVSNDHRASTYSSSSSPHTFLQSLFHPEASVSSISLAKQHFKLPPNNPSNTYSERNRKQQQEEVAVLPLEDANYKAETDLSDVAAVAKNATADDFGNNDNKNLVPIQHLLPSDEIQWIRKRRELWSWFHSMENLRTLEHHWNDALRDPHKHEVNKSTGFAKYQEDKDGPWMDFLIAGHPKTGTTTLAANLANIAPMKVKDFCVSKPTGLMNYLYDIWPKKFPEILEAPNRYVSEKGLQMVGSKCPKFIGDPELLGRYTLHYPRIKLIVGIRHPVVWYTSFSNMGHSFSPYRRMEICPRWKDIDPLSGIPGGRPSETVANQEDYELCQNECKCNVPICFHRARLHMGLARMGKTDLTPAERELLAPDDPDGGTHLFDARVRNPVFVYDQSQMKADSYWNELADFLRVSYIPNEHYHASKGMQLNNTLCDSKHDEFRSLLMEHSYNMSVWLENYFIPVGEDEKRPDVVIPDTTGFKLVVQTYKEDPCQRLVRNPSSGKYELDSSITGEDGKPSAIRIYTRNFTSCPSVFPGDKEKMKEKRKKNKELQGKKRNRDGGRHQKQTDRIGREWNTRHSAV